VFASISTSLSRRISSRTISHGISSTRRFHTDEKTLKGLRELSFLQSLPLWHDQVDIRWPDVPAVFSLDPHPLWLFWQGVFVFCILRYRRGERRHCSTSISPTPPPTHLPQHHSFSSAGSRPRIPLPTSRFACREICGRFPPASTSRFAVVHFLIVFFLYSLFRNQTVTFLPYVVPCRSLPVLLATPPYFCPPYHRVPRPFPPRWG